MQLEFAMAKARRPSHPQASPRKRPPKRLPQLCLFDENSRADLPHPADLNEEPEEIPPYPDDIRATISGQTKVETFLRTLLGPRLMVKLTENRSTMISFSKKRDVIYLRLHALFSDAPPHVLGAVAQFVADKPSPKSSWLIDSWIEAHRPFVRRPERGPRIHPRGEVHDLVKMYTELNQAYFENRVKARITWSQAARKQRRTTIRMGSYCDDEKLIRIHPALDQAFVPEYFVASVVFHEMLHQLHGAHLASDGSRRVHTPAFRKDEKKFREYELARAWEAKHIRKLLNY